MKDSHLIAIVMVCCAVSIFLTWQLLRDRPQYQRIKCGSVTLTVQVDKKYPEDLVCQAVIKRMQEDKK